MAEHMVDDWRSKIVKDFCKEHDVEFFESYEWKTNQNEYVMRKGNAKATRYVSCYSLWTLNHLYRPVDGKAQSIHQNYVGDRAGRWVLTSFFPEYYGQAESGLDPDFIPATRYFGIDDFGNTVFLSREVAEAALKVR